MSLRFFNVFTKTIARLPVQAIPKALELECKMLENDLECNRLAISEDTTSVLCFSQFVHFAKQGRVMRGTMPLPADHIEFYKETIVRLVHANVLPQSAMDQFDHAFISYI
jgi:hypothetical protein